MPVWDDSDKAALRQLIDQTAANQRQIDATNRTVQELGQYVLKLAELLSHHVQEHPESD